MSRAEEPDGLAKSRDGYQDDGTSHVVLRDCITSKAPKCEKYSIPRRPSMHRYRYDRCLASLCRRPDSPMPGSDVLQDLASVHQTHPKYDAWVLIDLFQAKPTGIRKVELQCLSVKWQTNRLLLKDRIDVGGVVDDKR